VNSQQSHFNLGDDEIRERSSRAVPEQESNTQIEAKFFLGPDENGPNAAKRFNDLIAKTLKLQE
jgi:hypothetical protein